jgi:hypothetical protein
MTLDAALVRARTLLTQHCERALHAAEDRLLSTDLDGSDLDDVLDGIRARQDHEIEALVSRLRHELAGTFENGVQHVTLIE